MLQTIERVAQLSIARGCGFAGLGIFTMMIGLSWDPALAFKAGGLLTLLACVVLLLKGVNARRRSYKHTEVWIMLPKDDRPKAEIAQQVIGNVLRDVCFRFAQQAAFLSGAMFLLAIVFQIAAPRQ